MAKAIPKSICCAAGAGWAGGDLQWDFGGRTNAELCVGIHMSLLRSSIDIFGLGSRESGEPFIFDVVCF